MADKGLGHVRRFAGTGDTAAIDYGKWKKWIQAHLIVARSRGVAPEAFGPMIYTYLDDDAEEGVEHLDVTDLEVVGGEDIIMDVLDEGHSVELCEHVLVCLRGVEGWDHVREHVANQLATWQIFISG